MFADFARLALRALSPPPSRRRASQAGHFHPRIEALESRCLLTGGPFNVSIGIDGGPYNIQENNGSADYYVTVSGSHGCKVEVPYTVGGGGDTAAYSDDYIANTASGTLTFNGDGSLPIHITGKPDDVDEDNKQFSIHLKKPTTNFKGAVPVLGVKTAQGFIVDDDLPPGVNISVPANVPEGGKVAATFTLGGKTEKTVTVKYTIDGYGGGMMHPGEDTSIAGGELTIKPGDMAQTVNFKASSDRTVENDEDFGVRATSITNGDILVTNAYCTIKDDDLAVVSIKGAAIPSHESHLEGNAGVVTEKAQIVLGNDLEKDLEVQWTTADGSASVGDSDYRAGGGQVSFAKGSKTGAIAEVGFGIVGDTKPEPTENFLVTLIQSAGYRTSRGVFTVNIINDDGKVPKEDIAVGAAAASAGGISAEPEPFRRLVLRRR